MSAIKGVERGAPEPEFQSRLVLIQGETDNIKSLEERAHLFGQASGPFMRAHMTARHTRHAFEQQRADMIPTARVHRIRERASDTVSWIMRNQGSPYA